MPLKVRSFGHRFACALLLAAATIVTAAPLQAQQEPPIIDGRQWRMLLEKQLLTEVSCDLEEVLLFDEFKRDGETVLEGKISCADGRLFDFMRPGPHQKFKLEMCEPAVC